MRLSPDSKYWWLVVLFIAGVMSFIVVWSIVGYQVDDQAVAVVKREIARLEKMAVHAGHIEIKQFEHRPGFKGKHVHVRYVVTTQKGAQPRDRYFNIRRPVFGNWYVGYEIEESDWNESAEGDTIILFGAN